VRALFAERQDGGLRLRRGFTLAPADRVLVVEDVVTTGGSTRETFDVARGGRDRRRRRRHHQSRAAVDLGVPFLALATIDLPTYEPTGARSARRVCGQARLTLIKGPGRRLRPARRRVVAGRPPDARCDTVRITLAYDGGRYAGWQRQANHPSVQAAVERALEALEGRPVAVTGAGRTDAGVHALGQVASFRLAA
jgi:hypothetical protein